MPLLPNIKTRDEFFSIFPKSDLWSEAVAEIVRRHGLDDKPEHEILGSNIVYRVGNNWVKIFAPFFDKEFQIELSGLRAVSPTSNFRIPEIIGQGELDHWHYMILSHIPGVRVGQIWKDLSIDAKSKLAKQFAIITRDLQRSPIPNNILQRYSWNDFIRERFEKSISSQAAKGLSQNSLKKLEAFVADFVEDDFYWSTPVFLHADLTNDHFLIDESREKVIGVIDFADAMAGHPEYDLAAYFSYLLNTCKQSRDVFFTNWGERIDCNRILMWIILHRFSDLNRYFGAHAFDKYAYLEDFASEHFG